MTQGEGKRDMAGALLPHPFRMRYQHLSFLRFDFSVPSDYYVVIYSVLPFFLAVKLISFKFFKLYQLKWRLTVK